MAAMAGASSTAAAKWVIHGRGFGHGVGMSQYGAYGYAKHGRDYKSILKHYYRHTRIGNADGSVKVLLASGHGSVGFANAHKACGKRLHRGRGYAFAESGSRVILESGRGRRITKCGRSGTAKGGHGIQVSGKGTYRGKLIAKASRRPPGRQQGEPRRLHARGRRQRDAVLVASERAACAGRRGAVVRALVARGPRLQRLRRHP